LKGAAAQARKPMNAAKKRAKAAGNKYVHEYESPAILHKGNFQLGTGNGGPPGIFLDLIHGEGASFLSTEQTDGRAEEDAAGARAN
jgi:hypothetical protein